MAQVGAPDHWRGRLADQAMMIGLDRRGVAATIRSGWEAGRRNPRTLEDRSDHPAPPPVVRTGEEFAHAVMDCYRRSRAHTMGKLKAAFEFGMLIESVLSSDCTIVQKVPDILDRLREEHGFRWSNRTIYAYRALAKHPWGDIAKCGSLTKAREWIAAQKRTPEKQKRLDKQRELRSMDRKDKLRLVRQMEQLERVITEQGKRIKFLEELGGACPHCGGER